VERTAERYRSPKTESQTYPAPMSQAVEELSVARTAWIVLHVRRVEVILNVKDGDTDGHLVFLEHGDASFSVIVRHVSPGNPQLSGAIAVPPQRLTISSRCSRCWDRVTPLERGEGDNASPCGIIWSESSGPPASGACQKNSFSLRNLCVLGVSAVSLLIRSVSCDFVDRPYSAAKTIHEITRKTPAWE
jgi:hypothetical protein